MEKTFDLEELKKLELNLPESVKNPVPTFSSPTEAIQFYSSELEAIASKYKMSVGDLRIAAHSYKLGADESFDILGLFDSLSTLKSIE